MDFLQIIAAGRRHWLLMTVGTVAGVVLALIAAFTFTDTDAGIRLKPRTTVRYQTKARLLITEPNLDVARMSPNEVWPNGYTKTVSMAPTYALLIMGDEVRKSAEEHIGPLGVKLSSTSHKETPVVELTVTGPDAQRTTEAAGAVVGAFIDHLSKQQDLHNVPQDERVKVEVLSAPGAPTQSSSGVLQVGALAFLAPILGFLALAASLDRSRDKRLDDAIRRL